MKYPMGNYTAATIWPGLTAKAVTVAPPAVTVWEVPSSLIHWMCTGIILPNLKMTGTKEACSFLDTDGRCTVHAFRPGICRMFPLGRFYENHSFQYFLQVHECPKTDRSKVKIKKWLDTPNLKTYEKYIADWHFFLKGLQEYVMNLTSDSSSNSDSTARTISMHVLTQFYLTPYGEDGNFYEEFYERLEKSQLFTQSLGI